MEKEALAAELSKVSGNYLITHVRFAEPAPSDGFNSHQPPLRFPLLLLYRINSQGHLFFSLPLNERLPQFDFAQLEQRYRPNLPLQSDKTHLQSGFYHLPAKILSASGQNRIPATQSASPLFASGQNRIPAHHPRSPSHQMGKCRLPLSIGIGGDKRGGTLAA